MVDLPWASKSVGNVRDAIINSRKPPPQGNKEIKLPEELLKKKPFIAPSIPKRFKGETKPEGNNPILEGLRKSLPDFKVSGQNGDLTITQNIGGYEIKISVKKNRSIGVSIDGSLGNKDVPMGTGLKIANQVRVAVNELVKLAGNGTPFAISAYTTDGKGENRVEALKRLGFGNVKIPGFPQFGIAQNGKITPSDYIREFVGLPPLQFKEESQTADVKNWYIVLFGDDPS